MLFRSNSLSSFFENKKTKIPSSSFHTLQPTDGMHHVDLARQESNFRELLLRIHSIYYHLNEFLGYFQAYFEDDFSCSQMIKPDLIYFENLLDKLHQYIVSKWPLPNTLTYEASHDLFYRLKESIHTLFNAMTLQSYTIAEIGYSVSFLPLEHSPERCKCLKPWDYWGEVYDYSKPAIHVPLIKRRNSI